MRLLYAVLTEEDQFYLSLPDAQRVATSPTIRCGGAWPIPLANPLHVAEVIQKSVKRTQYQQLLRGRNKLRECAAEDDRQKTSAQLFHKID